MIVGGRTYVRTMQQIRGRTFRQRRLAISYHLCRALESNGTQLRSRGQGPVAMTQYRNYSEPEFSARRHSARDWAGWLREHEILHDFMPRPEEACAMCGGSKNAGYAKCWDCSHSFSGELDALIAITYSFDRGLESLLHRYKDWGVDYRWIGKPLGALLSAAMVKHGACIRTFLGSEALFTWVPSNTPERGFDHIEHAVASVNGFSTDYPWRSDLIARNWTESKPSRKECKPEAYVVNGDVVNGRSILLVDDVYTSGASLVSASAAFKRAGATKVVGLTIGRQLNPNYASGTNTALCGIAKARDWSFDECALCA